MSNRPSFRDVFRVPMVVAGFRARVGVQKTHQEITFKSVLAAREKYEASQAALEPQIDDLLDRFGCDDTVEDLIVTNAAHQALYEDLGATLILIAAASVERLFRALGESVFSKGAETYTSGITFVEAIHRLANQYKHLGEWIHDGPRGQRDVDVVTHLVDNPLRSDAASEFLKRSGFTEYEQFETALLSCSDGIAPPDLVPDGRAGVPSVTLRLLPPEMRQ